MKRIALLSLLASSLSFASGYKIPETSTNAVALSAANVAHNKNADAAYYNPANMVFMSNENHIEAAIVYIGLDAPNYQGEVGGTGPYNIDAKEESFILPSMHYVSEELGESRARVGMSLTVPGGLSKRWESAPAKTSAEEFTLEIVEINPTAAFEVTDKLGVAVGFRIVNTSGIVKSDGVAVLGGAANTVSRDMTGDSIDFGYNLALAYQPIENLELGATYRSQVNLTVEGDATLQTTLAGGSDYRGSAAVQVPLPAVLNLAVAYTFPTQTTVEFLYEKTYWSAYKNLDFNYDGTEGPVLGAIFGTSIDKNWKDTNAYRLGITQEFDSFTLMAGAVIDESPVPANTLGFELPSSDSLALSFGGRYRVSRELDIGFSALYSMYENRTIKASDANDNGIVGEFTNSNVLLVSAGIGYKF